MEYELRKLQREIRALIQRLYNEGKPELIQTEIQKLLSKFKGVTITQAEQLRKQAELEIKNEFVKAKTPATEKPIDKMLKANYAVLKGKVNANLIRSVQRGIRTGMTIKQMTKLIDRNLALGKHRAKTVARTARVAQNRAVKIKQGIKSGAKLFKFAGPPPERDFCKEHFGQKKTLKQWASEDNGQGLPVIPYLGGFNCKHELIPVYE